ncbi:hypothetical protein EMCRGX_G001312 [Ephydatia muelleri]|eukprot:Em0001g1144a
MDGGGEQESDHDRTSVWNGYRLAVTTWKPPTSPKVLLFICHGVGEHMGRYNKLAKHLAEGGVLVYGHDHVGHGKSEGDRVHIERFDTYVLDVFNHIGDMNAEYPGVPSMMLGHSMGGLIATLVVEQHPSLISAILLSAPALDTIPAYGSLMANVTQYAVQLVVVCFPQAQLKTFDINDISSIPEEAREYAEDPMVYHGGMKAKFIDEFMNAVGRARNSLHLISLPLFLMHGDRDRLVPISASQFVQRNIGSESKTYEIFPEHCHEILHDKGQDRAVQLITDWIMARVTPYAQL